MKYKPLFSCEGSEYCRQETSYPIDMLKELPGDEGGPICETCYDDGYYKEGMPRWNDLPDFLPYKEGDKLPGGLIVMPEAPTKEMIAAAEKAIKELGPYAPHWDIAKSMLEAEYKAVSNEDD